MYNCYYTECCIPVNNCNPCNGIFSPYFLTNLTTSESISTGGTSIPSGSTTIPSGTIKLLTGYSNAPIFQSGNINLSGGYFYINKTGDCYVDGTINLGPQATGSFTFYLYKMNGNNNVIELIAANTTNFSSTNNTFSSLSSYVKIISGDRIFFGITQNTGNVIQTNIVDTRFSIKLI